MHNFNYHRPSSVADAVKSLSAASDGKILAGGHTLLPTMKQGLAAPSDLIDITGIAELKGIKMDGNNLVIGAATPHAEVAKSSVVKGAIPALAALAEGIGDAAVRNRGTIGGSISNNDPAADYPAGLVGLGATVHTNKRKIAADDFFKGLFETALEAAEIVTAVSFPKPEKAGYAKFPNPASRYAMVGVFVAKTGGGVRVAVTGAGSCVFRSKDLEQALSGKWSADAAGGVKVAAKGLNNDIHGSANYRAHLVTVMAKRAVAAAG
jgi:carbon-monoxide dehydrogenase medium subunit